LLQTASDPSLPAKSYNQKTFVQPATEVLCLCYGGLDCMVPFTSKDSACHRGDRAIHVPDHDLDPLSVECTCAGRARSESVDRFARLIDEASDRFAVSPGWIRAVMQLRAAEARSQRRAAAQWD
jgi:hypothetical protein